MTRREHTCPGGCGGSVPNGQFACYEDWRRLPGAIRARINQTALRRHGEPGPHRDAMAAGMAWYRDNPREVARG